MKFASTAVAAIAATQLATANPLVSDYELSQIQPDYIQEQWERGVAAQSLEARETDEDLSSSLFADLEKRRGGGGGGRGGGSSSSSSSSGSTGSRGGGTGGSRGTTSSSSSSPSFNGGRNYGGGSRTAYSPGSRSPGGIVPFAVGGAALGFGAFALWPASVYIYPWHTQYPYRRNGTRNDTRIATRQDDSGVVNLPVTCLCDPDLSCGCDDTGNSTYLDTVLGPNNQTNNASVATIQSVNGTDTVVLNGSLPDGDDDGGDDSGALVLHVQNGGYAVMAVGLAASLWVL